MRLYNISESTYNPKQITVVSQRTGIPEHTLTDFVKNYDQWSIPWILRQIGSKTVRIPEDKPRITDAIQSYIKYKQKLTQKDINQYQTITDLESAIEKVQRIGSKRSGATQLNISKLNGVKVLTTDNNYILYLVSDPISLSKMGHGTKWCTREGYNQSLDNQTNSMSEEYIDMYEYILVITILKNSIEYPLLQITPDLSQVQDINNNNFDVSKLPTTIADKILEYFSTKNVNNESPRSHEEEDNPLQNEHITPSEYRQYLYDIDVPNDVAAKNIRYFSLIYYSEILPTYVKLKKHRLAYDIDECKSILRLIEDCIRFLKQYFRISIPYTAKNSLTIINMLGEIYNDFVDAGVNDNIKKELNMIFDEFHSMKQFINSEIKALRT